MVRAPRGRHGGLMKSKWSDEDAANAVNKWTAQPGVGEDLALRVYTCHLIGREPTLVLHGGGNTSVKTKMEDDTGALVDVLCVKGSGWDLGYIEPPGMPAVRLESLAALRPRATLSDEDMVNAQRTRLLDSSSPNPSVETLLHAFLPAKFIDHSHADAILALADQPNAEAVCREVLGDEFAYVPYVMPGFALAKLAAEYAEANPGAHGLVLLKHGLFTWGATAKESYERHVAAVDLAEKAIEAAKAKAAPVVRNAVEAPSYEVLGPILRGVLGQDRRVVLALRQSDAITSYLEREDLLEVSQRGTPTPDHVIRTKRVPLVLQLEAGTDAGSIRENVQDALANYQAQYVTYVAEQSAAKSREVVALDSNPRVILVPGLGVITADATPKQTRVAADLHEHCIDVIEAAEAIGTYDVLPLGDVFDMEYWSLEQAKLGKKKPRALDGHVVLVTGAASGIGAQTARRFATEGACLAIMDRTEAPLRELADELGAMPFVCDVTDATAVDEAMAAIVHRFGGVDGVVSNAGIAPQGAMHEVSDDALRSSFDVNFFSHQRIAAAAVRIMRSQGTGGFVLFNASKAAFNPGKDFGPYAVPKAALVALMKQYALENGSLGIRCNAVNADRIRSGLLPADFVAKRAAARGLDADAYFRSNLLEREVSADDVAGAFVHLALAPSTTGCTITVDGGNIAASPR